MSGHPGPFDRSRADLFTAASPSYSAFTPRESVRSPTPDASIYSSLLQSPTRGLNFQSFSIIDEQPDHHVVENIMIEDPSFYSSVSQSPTEVDYSQSPSNISEKLSERPHSDHPNVEDKWMKTFHSFLLRMPDCNSRIHSSL
jgi:hypothetical protein